MTIDEMIMWIMMTFMAIAAIDRIFDQFGGGESVLGKVGLGKVSKYFSGAGAQFEEGFMAMGSLALAMVGMMALAPVLAKLLGVIVTPIYQAMGANPAMFATTFLALDMGGFPLAKELAGGDTAAFLYAGTILGAMMGPTIVFSIPVGLGIIKPSDRRFLAMGVLAGMITVPIGCLAGGLVAMSSGIVFEGQPIPFSMSMLLVNMVPVLIIALFLALGLKFFQEKMINGFQIFAKCLVAIITFGLAIAVLQEQLNITIIPGMDPIFMKPGDAIGVDLRAIEAIGKISCVLLGAYPMVFLITRWFSGPLMKIGKVLKMNDAAAAGMVATLANNIPMFGMMSKMDDRGKVLNVAFCVSAAFTFGDHLGFVAAVAKPMIVPMIVGKLVGGVTAIFAAILLVAPKPTIGQVVEKAPSEANAG